MDCVSRELTEKNGLNLLASLQVNHSKSADGKTFKDGRICTPERKAKAEAFWAKLRETRGKKGHCCRCGKKHEGEFRQCDRCRKHLKDYKARKLIEREQYDPSKAMAMIHQMRREVTKLREMFKASQRASRKDYARGYNAGKKHGITVAKYHDAYPEISKQELAQINHAFDNEGDEA